MDWLNKFKFKFMVTGTNFARWGRLLSGLWALDSARSPLRSRSPDFRPAPLTLRSHALFIIAISRWSLDDQYGLWESQCPSIVIIRGNEECLLVDTARKIFTYLFTYILLHNIYSLLFLWLIDVIVMSMSHGEWLETALSFLHFIDCSRTGIYHVVHLQSFLSTSSISHL